MPYVAESYIHEMDRKAFAALNTFPRFVKLVEAYHANYDEKAARERKERGLIVSSILCKQVQIS